MKEPLKIGVIDDAADQNMLQDLLPDSGIPLSVVLLDSIHGREPKGKTDFLPLNHGTLCTALLLEGLSAGNMGDKVEVVNIATRNGFGENALDDLVRALDYCIRHKIRLISVSLGVLNLLYARRMLPVVMKAQKEHVLIVAAAANDLKLTYPAAFRAVLGVKRFSGGNSGEMKIFHEPEDGIELGMCYEETPLLQVLHKDYQLDYTGSNSILVPQICAQAALCILENRRMLSKCDVLDAFRRRFALPWEKICKKTVHDGEEAFGNPVPVILCRYAAKQCMKMMAALKFLQSLFEKQDYACAVICDCIKRTSFENGWYKANENHIHQDLQYYQTVSSNSVFLVMVRDSDAAVSNIPHDLDISKFVISAVGKSGLEQLYEHMITLLT